jgi:hypothetical protein
MEGFTYTASFHLPVRVWVINVAVCVELLTIQYVYIRHTTTIGVLLSEGLRWKRDTPCMLRCLSCPLYDR